jgi:hypothetical protein
VLIGRHGALRGRRSVLDLNFRVAARYDPSTLLTSGSADRPTALQTELRDRYAIEREQGERPLLPLTPPGRRAFLSLPAPARSPGSPGPSRANQTHHAPHHAPWMFGMSAIPSH